MVVHLIDTPLTLGAVVDILLLKNIALLAKYLLLLQFTIKLFLISLSLPNGNISRVDSRAYKVRPKGQER